MIPYPIVIFWSEGNEAYIADVPDLRSCSAHGDTPEEALREVRAALDLRLEAARELGVPLPAPSRVGSILHPPGRR
ncbi:MAG: type II toxin-antitoxin system HicB family antitoxin [Chloroflexota bacterium]|nr:type II toxin-antitoxin system HicB family antitoxin [Chloroflexota bacterium]